jgi:hypothetical protein
MGFGREFDFWDRREWSFSLCFSFFVEDVLVQDMFYTILFDFLFGCILRFVCQDDWTARGYFISSLSVFSFLNQYGY